MKTVVDKDFVGVVCDTEWAAVKAAKALKVTWSAPLQAFPEQKDLYSHDARRDAEGDAARPRRTATSTRRSPARAKKIDARYDVPFQSHATMGPGCAVADVQTDGVTTVWSGGQKPHALQKGFAELLGVPTRSRARRLDAGRRIVRPSRFRRRRRRRGAAVEGGRQAGARAVDARRHDVVGREGSGLRLRSRRRDRRAGQRHRACRFTSRAFSGGEILYLPDSAGNYLGAPADRASRTRPASTSSRTGAAPLRRIASRISTRSAHVLAGFHDVASPLRSTHLRDPEGPATSFAVESFIDELAAAAGVDPLELRLKHIDEPRAKNALTVAAEKFGWDKRVSPKKNIAGDVVTGRGIALGTRNGTYVGTIAEVEVNRKTGVVKVTRLVCSHDCGLIVNPDALKSTIAANLVQSLGRTTKEEVMFDRSNVTSVDWNTYKVARASDVPAGGRHRPDQPARPAAGRRRRTVEPADSGGDRERRVRRHRRACPSDSAHASKRESRAGRHVVQAFRPARG